MDRIRLTTTHRVLVGVVVAGAVVIAAIGFAGSYTAVRDLARDKGFGRFAAVFPLGIDAGIVVLLALDLLLTWIRIPFPLLRQTAWLLTAATVAFNGAAAWPDPLGTGMHATIPVLFITTVEAARHAVGRIAAITADRHMEPVRLTRWLLAPAPTFRLWRRMKLWELRNYDHALTLERDRLVYRTRLRATYGPAWRRKAPPEAVLALKLTRYGIPVPRQSTGAGGAAGGTGAGAGAGTRAGGGAGTGSGDWSGDWSGAGAGPGTGPGGVRAGPSHEAVSPGPARRAPAHIPAVTVNGHSHAELREKLPRPRPAAAQVQRPAQAQAQVREPAPDSSPARGRSPGSGTQDPPPSPAPGRLPDRTGNTSAGTRPAPARVPDPGSPDTVSVPDETPAPGGTGTPRDGRPDKFELYYAAFRELASAHQSFPGPDALSKHLFEQGVCGRPHQPVSPRTLRRFEKELVDRYREEQDFPA